MESKGKAGFNFETFQKRLTFQSLTDGQRELLEARLELLKDFVRPTANSKGHKESSAKPNFAKNKQGKEKESNWEQRNSENLKHAQRQAAIARKDTWSFKEGSLTIVVSGSSRPTPSTFLWTGKSRTMFRLIMCPNDAFVRIGTLAPC